ncbi:MAG: hypothetical protein IJT79_06730 [Ruminococcus sp.]|nr:hypothetical protein [Ruminococcus sp.]
MNRNHLKAIDNLRASPQSVERALQAALMAEQSGKVKEMKATKKYYKPISIIAASLAVIIALGVILIPRNGNSFYINASAAEVEKGYDYKHSTIGAYSNESSAQTSINTDTGKTTYMLEYELTDFYISGKNVESVTMKANNKCTYFDILKDKSLFRNYAENNNTQYTDEERGAITLGCDSLTFVNDNPSDDEQKIDLSGKLAYVLEGDMSKPEIAAKIKQLGQNILKEQKQLTKKEEHAIYEQDTKLEAEIIKNTLKNATIDITVKFTDGKTETQTINVDYYYDSAQRDTQWITFTLE